MPVDGGLDALTEPDGSARRDSGPDVAIDAAAPRDDATGDAGVPPDASPWDNLPRFCESPDELDVLEPARFDLWQVLPRKAHEFGDADGDDVLEMYVNMGGGHFETVIDVYELGEEKLERQATWHGAFPLAVGDLDGDGRPEVVFAEFDEIGTPLLGVHSSSTAGSLDLDVELERVGAGRFRTMPDQAAIADTDGDGRMELIAGPPILIFERGDDGSIREVYKDQDPEFPLATDAIGRFSIGDFDADGRTDLSVPATVPVRQSLHHMVRVIENRGDGRYERTYHRAIPAGSAHFASSGDVDGDGVPEFLRGGSSFGGGCWHFGLYRSTGDDEYAPMWERNFVHGDNNLIGMTDMGDTDGDGDAEVAISMGDQVHLYEQVDGRFRRIFELRPCDTCPGAQLHLRDLDGDGRAELVVSRGRRQPGDAPPDPEGIQIFKRIE